jgi:poly(beta-D-mannuronate) lyase
MRSLTACFFFLQGFSMTSQAAEKTVADPAHLPEALPGDVLVLPEGEFSNVSLILKGKGSEKAPITLRAAVPGKTIFTGTSTLRIAGQHLVVEGLHFRDPDPSLSDLIEFRQDAKSLSSHCRLTRCAITLSRKQAKAKESRWVGLYGRSNRVDHCRLEGKTGKGTTLVVWLGGENGGEHRIDHNDFGPREKLGKNGGETIRIGDSKTSMLKGGCLVEANVFYRCNGEAECISNKSCENVYRGNTFLEVGGTLTLRHGNGCVVEGNVFLGNDASGTGGIRIIGEDHTVRGNYLENLRGDDGRSALCLMMGIPDSPLNRYFQVKRARVIGNMLVNCEHPVLLGLADDTKATLAPTDCLFEGNQFRCPGRDIVEARCGLEGLRWKNNVYEGNAAGIPGMEAGKPQIQPLKGLTRADVGPGWN